MPTQLKLMPIPAIHAAVTVADMADILGVRVGDYTCHNAAYHAEEWRADVYNGHNVRLGHAKLIRSYHSYGVWYGSLMLGNN